MKRGRTENLPAAVRDILAQHFTETVTRTFEPTGKEPVTYTYDAMPIDEERVAILESARVSDEEDTGNFEFRTYDRATLKDWRGCSVTVYGPELGWNSFRGDDTVTPGYVSHSSSSSGHSPTGDTRADALLLAVAADLADAWTEAATPQLIELAKKNDVEYQARMKKIEQETARKRAIFEGRLPDEGNQVRVKVRDKKVPLVGVMVAKNPDKLRIDIKLSYKEKPVYILMDYIEKFETKLTSTVRFDEVPLS
jgi:hypothetical protein